MTLIDTHTHLYLKEFSEDFDAVLERANRAGVSKFYLPGIDSESIESILQLEAKNPAMFFAMMGLHPVSVKENYKEELKIVEDHLAKRKFVAVGEIGLDYYWDTAFKSEQLAAFNAQMEMALHYRIPISIHTRNAMQDTLLALKPFADKGLKGIFHCFGDDEATAKTIIDMGFYLGIGGVVTYKNANLDESLKNISLEWIVLETDAPYLTPVPFRGKRNESSYLVQIAQKLAEIKKVTIAEVAATTTANATKVFAGL